MRDISISLDIPLASLFEKGGLRGIFSNATRTYLEVTLKPDNFPNGQAIPRRFFLNL